MTFGAVQNPQGGRNLHTLLRSPPAWCLPPQTQSLTLSMTPALNCAPRELASVGALRGAALLLVQLRHGPDLAG